MSARSGKPIVGRILLATAAALVGVGLLLLTGVVPVGGGVGTIVGLALVASGLIDAAIGVRFLVSDR